MTASVSLLETIKRIKRKTKLNRIEKKKKKKGSRGFEVEKFFRQTLYTHHTPFCAGCSFFFFLVCCVGCKTMVSNKDERPGADGLATKKIG